jgi:hypothetical protein
LPPQFINIRGDVAARSLTAFLFYSPIHPQRDSQFVTTAVFREIFERLGEKPLGPPEVVDALVAYADVGETGQVR